MTWRRAYVWPAEVSVLMTPAEWKRLSDTTIDVGSLQTIGDWLASYEHRLLTRRAGDGWESTYQHARTGFIARPLIRAETELDAAQGAVLEFVASIPNFSDVIPAEWISADNDAACN